MNKMIKATFLALALCTPALDVYADEQLLALQPTEQLKRELFIQDWIVFNQAKMNVPSFGRYQANQGVFDGLAQKAQQAIDEQKLVITICSNLKLQSPNYKQLVALTINSMEIYNLRMLDIIDENEGRNHRERVSTREASLSSLKVQALEQRYEVQILTYLLQTIKNQPEATYPFQIDRALMQDWLEYKLVNHRINTIPTKLPNANDTNGIAALLNTMTTRDYITPYQQLNPQTSFFKNLIDLQITNNKSNAELLSNASTKASNPKEAAQKLKKLVTALNSNQFKMIMATEKEIRLLEKQVDHQIFTALAEYYL